MYKFHYGPRPKFENVEITLETEIPAILPKDLRKQNPDKALFDKSIQEIDQKIENGRNKIRSLGMKKKEVYDGGKMTGSQLTFKEFIKQKIEECKELRD